MQIDALKVPYEIRRLSVGDFLWICRRPSTEPQPLPLPSKAKPKFKENCAAAEEYILPYIVERKRMDDFAGSIRDGRFQEQKFRLQNSGIPNLIYLIENKATNQHLGLPIATLMQAATNTQVQSGFTVKCTQSHEETTKYLAVMTRLLTNMFQVSRYIFQIGKSKYGDGSFAIDITGKICVWPIFFEFRILR